LDSNKLEVVAAEAKLPTNDEDNESFDGQVADCCVPELDNAENTFDERLATAGSIVEFCICAPTNSGLIPVTVAGALAVAAALTVLIELEVLLAATVAAAAAAAATAAALVNGFGEVGVVGVVGPVACAGVTVDNCSWMSII
jgi:hypothetical protein